jgi:peptide/nickel transport system permease protein
MATPQDITLDLDDRAPAPTRTAVSIFRRRFLRSPFAMAGLVVLLLICLMAIFAPVVSRGYDPTTEKDVFTTPFLLDPHTAPSLKEFPLRIFGTTELADYRRPVLAEIAYGARPTLAIGLLSAFFATLIGTLLGAVSGYFGGWIDAIAMRIADLALALPFMPLVIAFILASAQNIQSVQELVIIFSLVGWAPVARLVRTRFLVLREQDFTEAARAAGIGNRRIIVRHLLPNAVASITVAAVLSVAGFILADATMEYLQVIHFAPPGTNPVYTWGQEIAAGYNFLIAGKWWWSFFPGLFLTLTVLSLNYIGEGLRDAFDVQERLF